MPGTGKTATVHEVIRGLQADKASAKFDFVEINGMKLQSPHDLYSRLLSELTGGRAPPHKAAEVLQALFTTPGSRPRVCVLLVDELDSLMTKHQTVLYSLFDWPGHKPAKLVVIGIANTMDLPERLLGRISSRMGSNRVPFKAYSRDQIELILKKRLGEAEALFEPDSIDMCARKVASLSGDVRRALQMIRRAAEVCQRLGKPKVTLDHVVQAVRELDGKITNKALAAGSLFERLFLLAVNKAAQAANVAAVDVADAVARFEQLLKSRPGIVLPASAQTRAMCVRLGELGLLHVKLGRQHRLTCALAIDVDEMEHVLSQDKDLRDVQ
jgi:origin recognition complex subunit 1